MKTNYHALLRPGGIYHLYNKAVSERKLFYDDNDYIRFLTKFKKYFTPYLHIFAYCLIPNHFHLQVEIKDLNDTVLNQVKKEGTQAPHKFLSKNLSLNEFLSDQFRRFLSSHSLFINKKYDLNGPLLLKKIKKYEVKSEQKFYDLLCYIHHNPIHHRLTKSYDAWPYSSFHEYTDEDRIIDPNLVFNELGNYNLAEGKDKFLKLHEEYKKGYKEGF